MELKFLEENMYNFGLREKCPDSDEGKPRFDIEDDADTLVPLVGETHYV